MAKQTENIQSIYPLTPLQQGMLYHTLLATEGGVYVVQNVFTLSGKVNSPTLRRAWESVLDRHEVLRSLFVWKGQEKPLQVVPHQVVLPWDELDWLGLSEAGQQEKLESLLQEDRKRGFDLAKPPLMRMTLIRVADSRHELIWTFHHLLLDGWSMALVIKDAIQTYNALLLGHELQLPRNRPYRDYIRWLQQQDPKKAEAFWRAELRGFRTPTSFGVDRPAQAPAAPSDQVASVQELWPSELALALRNFAARHHLTPSTIVHGAWGLLLSRYCNEADVVFGSVVSGRPADFEGVESLVGPFINTLPVRVPVSPELSVSSWLKGLQDRLVALREYEHTSLVDIQGWSDVRRDQPLFESLLAFENYPVDASPQRADAELEIAGFRAIEQTNYPLSVTFVPGEQIQVNVTYSVGRFDKATITRLQGHFRTLLEGMVANPDRLVSDLSLLTEAERHQLLVELNATAREYGTKARLHRLIEARAARTPDAVALEFEGRELSYAQLNGRANQLARVLQFKGVGPDVLVGVFAERSFEMVVALLAVLKAGGAYVPLDPSYPKERLGHMLEDARAPLVLAQPALASQLPADAGPVLLLDTSWADYAGESVEDLKDAGKPDDLAYVIFTSGSTGRPKGAMNAHRGIVNRLLWMQDEYGLGADDAVLQKTPFSFDVSVWEFFWPLMTGARLVIARPEGHRDSHYLVGLIGEKRITTLHFVPSMLRVFLEEEGLESCRSLKRVICSGEALPHELQERFFARLPGVELHNLYGPTEAAVDVTYWACRPGDERLTVPIGRPVANTQIYVLDGRLEPVPMGVAGELYIGGVQVGRGYVGRPELTSERFVPDPFSHTPGARLYRTGDLVRHLPDGAVEYLGRLDYQVKIRGQRIELGEIEATLDRHAGVGQSVVMARGETRDQQLVAYVVRRPPAPSSTELKEHLSRALPAYMVPNAFVFLEELPLTSSGKVDRKLLPAPERSASDATAYVAPRTPTEVSLAGIWGEVLGLERVGIDDNFFELGGHSLLAISVIERMRRVGLHADVRALFATPSLAALAAAVGGSGGVVEVPPNGIPPGCEALTPEMLSLVQLTSQDIERIVRAVPGGAANVQDIYPLAPLQEGILFHHLMATKGDPYLLHAMVAFDTRARLEKYLQALQAVIDRHDILRTAVLWEGLPEPVQVVWRRAPLIVEEVSLDAASGDVSRQLGERFDPRHYRLDVRQAPLLRAFIADDVANARWVMLLQFHHLSIDHTTVEVVHQEIQAYLLGQAAQLPTPLPFRNFVAQARLGVSRDEHDAFFRKMLGDVDEPTAPFGLTNVQGDGSGIAEARREVDAPLAKRLRARARALGVTAASVCHLAWAQVLARVSGRDDVVFGTLLFGRMQGGAGADRVLGLFINTLPVRIQVGDEGVQDSVRRTHTLLAQLLRHEHAPLALAQRCSAVAAPAPLFSALLNYRHMGAAATRPSAEALEASAGIETLGVEERTNYPLVLSVDDLGEGFALTAQVQSPIDPQRICELMHTALEQLTHALESAPSTSVRMLDVLPASERRQLVVEWNETSRGYPAGCCVHELVEEQARMRPEALAAECGGRRLSYGELDQRADQLAQQLRKLGVGANALVAVYLERSLEMMVALLGVWKAGGAYVPIDPEYPADRVRFMLEDTKAVVVLSQKSLAEALSDSAAAILYVDAHEVLPAASRGGSRAKRAAMAAQQPAYVIYTSGSTGRPKGVPITHENLCNLIYWHREAYQVTPADRATQIAGPAFDASVWEIWPYLTAGASVHIPDDATRLDPGMLVRWLDEHRITLSFLPTPLAEAALRKNWPQSSALRVLLTGGDRLGQRPAQKLPFRLVNHYGPTENTVVSTCVDVETGSAWSAAPPIGRPLPNTRAYVVDRHLQPVPIGVAGELLVGGVQLASGYWNRPELTAEKFIADPFDTTQGARLYRTGDLARYLPDGNIEFIGRIDNQVKIRGFRIELGEIETVLGRLPQVQEAVVVVREDGPGDKRIVAYVVPKDGQAGALGELPGLLKRQLPDYMVPSAFVTLDKLPLTPNGKVDRKALPEPNGERRVEHTLVAPRSELEQRIAAVWREMLHLDQVGVNDNFFDLGGHSLLVIKICDRLCADLNCELKIVDLFTYPTIEALAKFLGAATQPSALAEEAHARVKRRNSDSGQVEPIAIIGMAGRFPGAGDIETFWANLRQGRESIVFFSKEEMRESGVPESNIDEPNYVGARGYLENADKFDAAFFGYSAREAEIIDPQQRLLLECASEVLERAGYNPDRYDGLIGVYAGSSMNTYMSNMFAQHNAYASASGMSVATGSGQDFLTTRISYKLNLRGPSLNVQTACSTSLVAVHQACRALWGYECDMALAGGVSVSVPLKSGYSYVEEGIGSKDGHCRAFDAGANGTVSGNGVAMVMLKRLSEALADGDQITAVIRGTAINNDGSSKVGYTAPSVEGQAKAISLAYASAQCDPDTIDYVETHGTGTLLGDPIEVAALTRVFGDGRRRHSPCWLGSLKTNVGHLDAAAGVGGLIKAALSLENKEMVPSLHFSKPNPQIDFAAGLFKVNSELREWESSKGTLRRAGVSSFGIGGTNAHVVLEEAPALEPSEPSRGWQLLCLSAKTADALEQSKANLSGYLRDHSEINLADTAYTLQLGRRNFSHRCVVVCRDVAEAVSALRDGNATRVTSGIHSGGDRSVAFMFSGQGAQYPNMGQGLYETEPVFRETLDQCCEKLKPRLGLDLREVLFPSKVALEQASERLKQTALTQPALFAVEYALARLWMSLGIQPAVMIGHSIGEYVAACLADVISLDDALDLVAERGRLMGQLPPGSMLAVPLSEAELLPLLSEQLSIASINGPTLCVVSGPEAGIAALEARLITLELAPRRLHTSHAFHSSMMDPILDSFTKHVSAIKLNPPRLPYISNLTGDWITAEQATDPSYYAAHLRQAVQFAKGLERLFANSNYVFLELGPGQTLAALARRHPAKKEAHAFVGSMRHPDESRDDEAVLMESVGRLWLAGARPDWMALHAGHRRHRVRLPTYPFERKRYWIEPSLPSSGPKRIHRRADPREWIYVPSWKRVPMPSAVSSKRSGNWLLFVDRHGLGMQLAAELSGGGASVATVAIGERFAKGGPGEYALNPAAREDYDRLVAELRGDSFTPDYIVHLWSVSRDEELREDAGFVVECEDRGFFSAIFLAQAMENGGLNGPMGLAVLTTNASEVSGNEVVCPEKAMVLGPCKVIGMEHPHIRTRSIDVTVNGDLKWLAHALTSDLCSTWTEPVVSYRGRYRWAQAFEPIRPEALADPSSVLREGGTYLITGGLGAVGLEIADHLARSARAKVVLVSRSPFPAKEQWTQWLAAHDEGHPTSRKVRRLQAIEAGGAQVLVCQADVADERQMGMAIAEAETRFGPLCGVMHAAGAEKRGVPILSVQRGHCEEQFRPKLQGLRTLEKVLHGKSLDFCLVHSSLASVMGVMGFVSYTASHLYMDAFVHRHNREGGAPWKTINWDNWSVIDADAEDQEHAKIEFYMTTQGATEVLTHVLSRTDASQFVVSTGDLQGRIDQWVRREEQPAEGVEAGEKAPGLHAYSRPALSTEYEAPRTDAERKLAGIWAEMLGIDRVGIHDNFFELGGDSVLNIQITAKANQAGVRLTPRQVFEHQTVAALASIAGAGKTITAEQGVVTGPVPLTPVQHWFFGRDLPHPGHFNLPMLLEVARPLDVDILAQVIERLEQHHDALRLRYLKTEEGWTQRLVEPSGANDRVQRIDLAALSASEQHGRIEAVGTEQQKSLDLVNGPLLKVTYFDLGPGQPGYLLFAIHHLIVDMVSWRILLEDVRTLYESLSSRRDAVLPAKTASIRLWAETLSEYAQTKAAEAELDYWLNIGAGPASRLPVDLEVGANTMGSSVTVHEELGEDETRALLTDLPRAYKTQINDVLLLALVKAMCGWTGGSSLLVDLEGHGREAILDGIDVSRTVGWFTTLSPVRLELPAGGHRQQLSSVKAQLQAVPHHGMGFGVLRHLNSKRDVCAALANLPSPDMSFLYMGQFDQTFSPGSLFAPASGSVGPPCDPDGERFHLLEINGIVSQGRLRMSWNYCSNRHTEATIRSLARAYMGTLRSLIASCQSGDAGDEAVSGINAGKASESDLAEIRRQLSLKARGTR